jgi:hypothetical protein
MTLRRAIARILLIASVFTVSAVTARAQGRLEISGSFGGALSHDLGSETAVETGNGVPTGSPVTLFRTSSSMDAGPLFEARVGFDLTRAFAVEATFGLTRTTLRTSITNDFEQAAPTMAVTKFRQYAIEGGIVWHLTRVRFSRGRAVPFVAGGGGYLRQLDDGATLVGTGQSIYAGGGLKYRLHESKPRSALKAIGLRADVRVNVTHHGFDIDEARWRAYPSVSGGVFVRF